MTKDRVQLLANVAMAILQSAQEAWTAGSGRGSLSQRVEEAFDVFHVRAPVRG